MNEYEVMALGAFFAVLIATYGWFNWRKTG